MSRLLRRLRRLIFRSRFERDVDRELAFHLDMETGHRARGAVDPAVARASARRDFGDTVRVREGIHLAAKIAQRKA